MRSIQVQDGDIQRNSGQLSFVDGSAKLIQDLTLWLTEPGYGNPPQGPGYTTPSFFSLLDTYIGQSNSGLMQTQVKSEVFRILGLYQETQILRLKEAQTYATLAYWNKSQIINRVGSIDVMPVVNSTITVNVILYTLANTELPLSIIIGQDGIAVI